MHRSDFKTFFGSAGTVVLPVIHVTGVDQTRRNVDIARDAGVPGVFLINHDFGVDEFLPIIRDVREGFPDYWVGVNFLAVTGAAAFPVLGRLADEGTRVDAYWADDARVDERTPDRQDEALTIAGIRKAAGWNGMYFGSVAFKKQRHVDPANYAMAAELAIPYVDVVTTSGTATGEAAALDKITDFRRGCGDQALALASGITPENAARYTPRVDAFLVATGINPPGDFYNIDPRRLRRLIEICGELQ